MADTDPAAVARRLMAERGMSLRATAKAAGFDPSYLSKVFGGIRPFSAYVAGRLDKALNAGGAIREAAASRRSPSGVSASGPVAPELAAYFATQLAGHYSADRFLGPLRLIPTAVPQYELLCDLAAAADGNLRRELWSMATGFAAFIGWLYQDAGDIAVSSRWLDVMIERAHRSHDPQLVAFALHNKAMLIADTSDGRGVLDLTGAALRHEPDLCPKVRVLLLQQAAHGTSMAGGNDAAGTAGRLLDEAAGLLDGIDDEYPWGGSCQTPGYLDVQRATVYTRLGRAREALALWDSIIPALPASSRRDLGVFRARQAQALADAGEPEQAVAIASQIAPVIAETGSARMRAEVLSGLTKRMKPWRHHHAGRDLNEVLSVIRRQDIGRGTQGTDNHRG